MFKTQCDERNINIRVKNMGFRIGHGYDVHRFAKDRELILGGVKIPHDKGLLGHSDADVATHALMDAMLGSVGLGDIGKHFPDSSEEFAGADSIELLKTVAKMLCEKGYRLVNADITIIAQAPKLAPYIPAMRKNIAEAVGVCEDDINIKATTEEHLGFTGEELGIAAHAVCLSEK